MFSQTPYYMKNMILENQANIHSGELALNFHIYKISVVWIEDFHEEDEDSQTDKALSDH